MREPFEQFKMQVRSELVSLSAVQIVSFAWLCGVRVLPCLGEKEFFEMWGGKSTQKYLAAVFRALDVACFFVSTAGIANVNTYATNAAYDAIGASNVAATAAANAAAATAAAHNAAADVTYLAATAADAATDAADAASMDYKVNLRSILLKDIDLIRTGRTYNIRHDVGINSQIWDNFRIFLRDRGCEYWWKVYERIFAKGFVLDQEERESLERRMNVPTEIQDEGAAAMAQYLTDLEEQGGKRLNEARVIILGEKGAGKTCLARRLVDLKADMTSPEESTEGVDTSLWEIPGRADEPDGAVNAHIWDFAGHVITHAVHRCFLSERCLYILVYNGRIENENRPEYWLDQIKTYGGDAPVLILVNSQDGHRPDFPEPDPAKYPSILGTYPVDIASDRGALKAFRQTVMDFLRDNPAWKRQEIPAKAYHVKEALFARFRRENTESISRREFDQIAEDNGVPPEEREPLLRNLNALGICLWYDRDGMAEYDTLILNPGWIGNGVYKLINWGHDNKRHILTENDSKVVFADQAERYPEDKRRFLFELMRTFELAFFKRRDKIFVPLLLPQKAPDRLPDFPVQDRLHIQYAANQELPLNTVSRLIVRHHAELRGETGVWRYGAALHDGETTALVRESREERTVNIYVKGPDKTGYIGRLRAAMDDIFDSYKSKKPELYIEVLVPEEAGPGAQIPALRMPAGEDGLLVAEKIIKGHVLADRPFFDAINQRDIPLNHTVQYYNIVVEGSVGNLALGAGSTIDAPSFIFNFHDCTLNLQGDLYSLARGLRAGGRDHDDDAGELELAAEELEQVQAMITPEAADAAPEVKAEVKKKGLLKRLTAICKDLSNEESALYKRVSKIRRGIETARNIAKQYNDIAQWLGLPQVPRPLLGAQGNITRDDAPQKNANDGGA